MQTLARKLSETTFSTILDVFGLEEVGAPFIDLSKTFPGPGGKMFEGTGSVRIWKGGPLRKMVYVGYSVADFGVDSHMIFAFPQPDSIVPTFTLDSVFMSAQFASMTSGRPTDSDTYAFHLDLVPRCDLGVNFEYMQRCYHPIEAVQSETEAAAGITPALLNPTQRAVMSPWMLANRSTPQAYENSVFPAANRYLQHWVGLMRDGLDELRPAVLGMSPGERDVANRKIIFSREVDPVWEKMDRMLGKDRCEQLIRILRNPEVETLSDAAL